MEVKSSLISDVVEKHFCRALGHYLWKWALVCVWYSFSVLGVTISWVIDEVGYLEL